MKHIDFSSFLHFFSVFAVLGLNDSMCGPGPAFSALCQILHFLSIWLVLMGWHSIVSNFKFSARRLWCSIWQVTRKTLESIGTSPNL